ncbi:MAG: hypothetical protein O7E52_24235 [Candidatus Poribacteria bacterium]|nr:hypothetical protein [Candidatus Poribacteria bacterium]
MKRSIFHCDSMFAGLSSLIYTDHRRRLHFVSGVQNRVSQNAVAEKSAILSGIEYIEKFEMVSISSEIRIKI